MWVGHVLGHVLNHMIITLVTMALQNNWSNKHKNNYDYLQYQTRSGNGESFKSGIRGLEPAKGLERTATPDVQEADVGN